jgi:hypothetical protein
MGTSVSPWLEALPPGVELPAAEATLFVGRGLHSSTSQLNLSHFRPEIHLEHPPMLLNSP